MATLNEKIIIILESVPGIGKIAAAIVKVTDWKTLVILFSGLTLGIILTCYFILYKQDFIPPKFCEVVQAKCPSEKNDCEKETRELAELKNKIKNLTAQLENSEIEYFVHSSYGSIGRLNFEVYLDNPPNNSNTPSVADSRKLLSKGMSSTPVLIKYDLKKHIDNIDKGKHRIDIYASFPDNHPSYLEIRLIRRINRISCSNAYEDVIGEWTQPNEKGGLTLDQNFKYQASIYFEVN